MTYLLDNIEILIRVSLLTDSYSKVYYLYGLSRCHATDTRNMIRLVKGYGKMRNKRILSGLLLILLLATALSTGTSCSEEAEALTITNIDLSGYTVYDAAEKTGNPAAGAPEYIFLVAGKEAVTLEGPEVGGKEYFIVKNEKIREVGYGYFEDDWDSGYEITINSHLAYTIAIEDFEDEVYTTLAEVLLKLEGNTIESTFIFAASPSGSGVAHDIEINALIDGEHVGSVNVGSIEVRNSDNPGTQVSLKRLSNGEETALDPWELDQVPFTDFAIIVDFNTEIQPSEGENRVIVYREFWEEWADTDVKVFAQKGTVAGFQSNAFFPEDDPASEVSVQIEIISDDSIMVSPVSGGFPSGSQVVLSLDFGEFAPPGLPPAREGYIARIFT